MWLLGTLLGLLTIFIHMVLPRAWNQQSLTSSYEINTKLLATWYANNARSSVHDLLVQIEPGTVFGASRDSAFHH
jgi:hypothetical protein